MIDRRGGQAGAPPCVFSRGRLDLPVRPIYRPAARSPPLAQELELPAQNSAGPGGGAALAQLLANPDRMTLEGIQYERGYARGRSMQGPGQFLSQIGRCGAAASSY
jgi:hypothetical protein